MNHVLFKNATVLDVIAGVLIPNQRVIVKDSRIAAVGADLETPRDARSIDVAGRILMPGLCDAHVHVTALTADFAALGRLAPSYVTAQAAQIAHGMLLRG